MPGLIYSQKKGILADNFSVKLAKRYQIDRKTAYLLIISYFNQCSTRRRKCPYSDFIKYLQWVIIPKGWIVISRRRSLSCVI